MQGYPEQFPMGAWNTVREPYHTNIHTHGLHISGNPGADDVMRQIEPGDDGVYTYKIPCDHAGM
jgi:FtsP/CotA-like multicopper oxidase with cupredoxin domain